MLRVFSIRGIKRAATVALAAAMAFFVVGRGAYLCLCDEDPDGCGHICHECGTPSADGLGAGEDCFHIELPAVDLAVVDNDVSLPVPVVAAFAVPAPPPVALATRDGVPPCETSPPFRQPGYCSYSNRLYPRS